MPTIKPVLLGLSLLSVLSGTAQAALIAYTADGATEGLVHNGLLNIGRQFAVSGTGITVRDLGVFDLAGNGLLSDHVVTLFRILSGAGAANATVEAIAGGSITVPNGSGAALASGFRFTSLLAPLYLGVGNYSVIAYGFNTNSTETYGEGGGSPAAGNVTNIGFTPFQFTATASPGYPSGGDTNLNLSSASFRYDLGNTVPAPGVAALLLGGMAVLAGMRRRRGSKVAS